MTHFLKDILRQPEELQGTIERFAGPTRAGEDARGTPAGRQALEAAAAAIREAPHVYLTGIGSSWHAALNVGAMFHQHAHPVYLQDAAELLQFASFPKNSAVVILSRSGKSVEIVQLAAKARKAGATVIGITNVPDSPLANEAHVPIVVPVALDHAISVNTYTTIALTAGLLASSVIGQNARGIATTPGCAPHESAPNSAQARVPVPQDPTGDSGLAESLTRAVAETGRAIPEWQEQIAKSAWLAPRSTTYFLARGSSLGSAYEARLMWEEGVKNPATAMGTGAFRHGPQEIVAENIRCGIWIDAAHMREQDLALARDLRQLGAKVMLVGQNLSADAGDLVFQLPATPPEWQFLIDIIPAQLTAEHLSRLSGVDCDTFRLCSFIVEDEYGVLPKEAGKN